MADLAGYLQIAPWPPRPDVMFWAALMMVAGGLIGEWVYRTLGWPRIVGYSAVGMLLALLGRGGAASQLHGTLRLIVDLALGLLVFEFGARVNLRWLRANPALLLTSAAEVTLSFLAMFGVLRAIGTDSNVALTCAAIGVTASASVVGRVAGEFGSAGQVSERMIVLTALNTLAAVLLHKLAVGWLHVDVAGHWVQGISQPLWTFGGSVLVAALLARLVAWMAHRLDLREENSVLLLLGLIVLALSAARMLGLSTLLVPLIAGVMLRNSADRPWVWPRHFGTAGGVLVLMLFVIVGAAWTPQALAAGGVAALLLLAARAAAKGLAVVALARPSGIGMRQSLALAVTLTPLSGTALVLLADLQASHPTFAPGVAPIVFSAIAIMELIGPIVVQQALRWAGELQPRRAAAKEASS